MIGTRLKYWQAVGVIFFVFIVANSFYLHRVPGLLGDEASEGESVYQLLQEDSVTVVGERSYIGPFIDYLRVPFVALFGYTALALRALMLVFSLGTFWLAWWILKRLFGEVEGLFALVMFSFSPVYLLYQRLGWAITLIPFFFFLTLFLLIKWRDSGYTMRLVLLAGLAAGLGAANHILFLPVLLAMAVIWFLAMTVLGKEGAGRGVKKILRDRVFLLFSHWPALVGFWAGFGMQFVVLNILKEDQGNLEEVAAGFYQRIMDLWTIVPLVVSGSSYGARYIGRGMGQLSINLVFGTVLFLCIVAVLAMSLVALRKNDLKKAVVLLWVIGIVVNLGVLLYMVDRYSLRYFVMFALGMWVLAGAGAGAVLRGLFHENLSEIYWLALLGSMGLTMATIIGVWVPFLSMGGSLESFSLGNRQDSAAAFVDERPLVLCLRGAGSVYSENIHVWNRLRYLSREYNDLIVIDQGDGGREKWRVDYRLSEKEGGDLCPQLKHFVVKRAK